MSGLIRCNKGKFATKKILNKRSKVLKRVAAMNRMKAMNRDAKSGNIADGLLEGRRIVDFKELAKNLMCCQCNKQLYIQHTVGENINGLHSILKVKCVSCSHITAVPTGKMQVTKDQWKHSDVNTRAVLGAVHAGADCSSLNKILGYLDIPVINQDLFERYEREVGPAMQEAARWLFKKSGNQC